jgi:hypothetical protein
MITGQYTRQFLTRPSFEHRNVGKAYYDPATIAAPTLVVGRIGATSHFPICRKRRSLCCRARQATGAAMAVPVLRGSSP